MTKYKFTYIFTSTILLGKVLLAEDLSVIIVDDNKENTSTTVSAQNLKKVHIENSMHGNGQISSLLEQNPNIKVNDSSNSSSTAGEISAGKISINNAPFYQNNFQIDGISNNSLIDPNLSDAFDFYDVPGNENETSIDLDLIESISIYDSNISAQYGGFTGGVIDAKTIRAKNKPFFKFSHRFTGDNLTKFHIHNSNKNAFNSAANGNQPRFDKKFYTLYYGTPINDKNGVIFSYNQKQSLIPLAHLGSFKNVEKEEKTFFIKTSHYFEDDSILDLIATHNSYNSENLAEWIKDSSTIVQNGGSSLKANYEKSFDTWNLKSNLAVKYSENTKDSLNYRKEWFKTDEKDWGEDLTFGDNYSKEGGYGNIKKEQKGINYKLQLKSEAIEKGNLSHIINTGLELNYDQGTYNRKENFNSYTNAKRNFLVNCNGDYEACEDGSQFFTKRKVYQKENTSTGMLSTAYYIENEMLSKKFEFTPGLRLDYNDYLNNFDLAHRLNASFKPFSDNKTILYAGVNRYFGKSFLGYKLREARLPYYEEYRDTSRNILQDWGSSTDKDVNKYIFSTLETPYTDEFAFGLDRKSVV